MLKRPNISESKQIYSLCSKFNSILEKRLHDGKHHHIMSITVQPDQFCLNGDLTSVGAFEFWKEIIRAFTKFDKDEISLNPQALVNNQAVSSQ